MSGTAPHIETLPEGQAEPETALGVCGLRPRELAAKIEKGWSLDLTSEKSGLEASVAREKGKDMLTKYDMLGHWMARHKAGLIIEPIDDETASALVRSHGIVSASWVAKVCYGETEILAVGASASEALATLAGSRKWDD